MAISTQQFCATWRQKIGTIDPCEPDARQRLNTAYSALVQELRGQTNNPDLSVRRLEGGGLQAWIAAGLDRDLAESVLNALIPVYIFDDEQLLYVAKTQSRSYENACFLDADPIAEILLKLSKTRLVDKGIRVEKNTLYPDDVYWRLAKHRNSTPKRQVAGCLHTPLDVLEELLKSTSNEIIYPLACNPMTPLPVLRDLLSWSGWGAKKARGFVNRNPAFLKGDAWQLMEIGRVMTAVDQRKRAVLDAILDLLEAHETIAESLRLLLHARLFPTWRQEPAHLRLQMIQGASANHDVLMAAAWSWSREERLAVARSPFAPQQALDKLCRDGLASIQNAACKARSHKITP